MPTQIRSPMAKITAEMPSRAHNKIVDAGNRIHDLTTRRN